MTVLGPLLMAAMVILPAYLSEIGEATTKKIVVLDETGWFYQKFKSGDKMEFTYTQDDFNTAKQKAMVTGAMLLYIPMTQLNIPVNAELYSEKQPGLNVRAYIKTVMKRVVENKKLLASGIDPEVIKASKVNINLVTVKVAENGEEKESYTEVEVGLAIFAGILIYFFIFMFGAQVLKGVVEEKSNRIVEVLVSSVKPFQLMMGKIVGIALVGLTQFLLWIILTGVFIGVFQAGLTGKDISEGIQMMTQSQSVNSGNAGQTMALVQMQEILGSIDFRVMIFSFLFYFLAGYLLYASLFAAIGGAVDNDADTQQFMLPITIPLIFSVVMSSVVVNQPDSSLSVFLSMFPFTSPVIMMMRIPFGVPMWQIWLSVVILLLTFVFTVWIAAKIYRIGILIYGKKVNYAELWKWLKY